MAFLIIGSACKKKKEDGVAEKLMKKWSLVQITDTTYSSSASPLISSYEGKTGDYMDFSTAGRLYSFINDNYDTTNYTYSEQNYKVNVRDFRYNILTLTGNTMVLHEPRYSNSSSPGDYKAYKITLRR